MRPSGMRAVYGLDELRGCSLATPASVSVLTRTPFFAQYVAR